MLYLYIILIMHNTHAHNIIHVRFLHMDIFIYTTYIYIYICSICIYIYTAYIYICHIVIHIITYNIDTSQG